MVVGLASPPPGDSWQSLETCLISQVEQGVLLGSSELMQGRCPASCSTRDCPLGQKVSGKSSALGTGTLEVQQRRPVYQDLGLGLSAQKPPRHPFP